MITTLVVDDHPIFRNGISKILGGIPQISRCDVAVNGKAAIEAMEGYKYDVVFMDLQMPVMDGYQATDIIIKKFPETKVIIISMVDTKREVLEVLKKNVHGYILKSADENEITKAINKVLDGHTYLSDEINEVWAHYVMDRLRLEKAEPVCAELSAREKEVIRLLCAQLTTAEIADKLFISEATVKNHRARIMKKLNTDNAIGIAMYAVRTGLYIP